MYDRFWPRGLRSLELVGPGSAPVRGGATYHAKPGDTIGILGNIGRWWCAAILDGFAPWAGQKKRIVRRTLFTSPSWGGRNRASVFGWGPTPRKGEVDLEFNSETIFAWVSSR